LARTTALRFSRCSVADGCCTSTTRHHLRTLTSYLSEQPLPTDDIYRRFECRRRRHAGRGHVVGWAERGPLCRAGTGSVRGLTFGELRRELVSELIWTLHSGRNAFVGRHMSRTTLTHNLECHMMSPDDAARYHCRPYRMPLKGQVPSALLGRRRLAPSVCPPGLNDRYLREMVSSVCWLQIREQLWRIKMI